MNQQHRCCGEVETEIGHNGGIVGISAAGIFAIGAIAEHVGGVDAYSPLHIAGREVDFVDRPIGLMHRRCNAHECEMSACRTAHYAYFRAVEPVFRCLGAHHLDGALQVLPCCGVLGKALGARSAIGESHHGHAQTVEKLSGGHHFEAH